MKAEFGYYPHPLDIAAGDITVATLPDRDEAVKDVTEDDCVDAHWIYSGPKCKKFLGGPTVELPYPARIFGLPKTHSIEHSAADNQEHLDFHVWVLSFFLDMRLTTTERGFVDATPLKPGKLTDFVLSGDKAGILTMAEDFWIAHRNMPDNPKRWGAAVHALFLSYYPQSLQFESFIYLYTALDACYALMSAISPPSKKPNHSERIAWMCDQIGTSTPLWADPASAGSAEVASIRNPALHEGLYMGEALGFALHGIGRSGNLILEMQTLCCRFLAALIGVKDRSYIEAVVTSRQRQLLKL